MNEIVGNIVEIHADVAADDHNELSLAPITGYSPALGDWKLLTQLFANLVENAIRHTAPGTAINITIRTRARLLSSQWPTTAPAFQ